MKEASTTPMKDASTDIENLIGIGPVSAAWLRAVGVTTQKDLERLGAAEAYARVEEAGFGPTLNLLWALEGARRGVHWTQLSPKDRDRLKQDLKKRR